jgi:hemoglobin
LAERKSKIGKLIMSISLYERLGGTDGIHRIADVLVDNHATNPVTAKRFLDTDLDQAKKHAAEFVISGTGGPNVYTGKDMIAVHRGMNISEAELIAVMSDALDALDKNNIGQREQEEVLFILFSMRNEVLAQ